MLEKILVKEVIMPVIIVVASFFTYFILKNVVKKLFKLRGKKIDSKRKKTIIMLINSIIKFFIGAIAVTMILDVYGIDTKTLLASLGVVAAVAGFALQDLLKDFIAGLSIMLEGQYRIGDTITVGTFKGEVVSLGLKSTRIKAYTGEIKIFSNRLITEVINHNFDHSLAIVDIPISYETNLEKVEKILTKLCDRLTEEIEDLKGPITLLGANVFEKSSISVRITAETVPMKQYDVQRKILREVKIELDKNNIKIPYTSVVSANE